jgi:DNA modification methylase
MNCDRGGGFDVSTVLSWPADRVERWSVARLIPYARNARTHSAAQVAQIAASIREWGWTNPVLVDADGTIIAGHGRVLAAQQLAIADVPVMVAAGWSEAQRHAYVIADNKLAENAGWDMQMLAAELQSLQGGAMDLALLGFSDTELEQLLQPEMTGLTDPDDAPALGQEAVSQAGDVWQLDRHRLMCADACDATSVRTLLGAVRPTLMVTDPPYGVDYDPVWRLNAGINKAHQTRAKGMVTNDERADWRDAWTLFPGDVAYVWHGGRHASTVQASLEASAFEIRCQIIWAKPALVIGRGHYHWQHEPCWYAVRKGAIGHWAGDRKQSTLWQIANMHRTQGNVDDGKTMHSTQKPVECMRRPMINNSSAGQAIYEPFCGSGTSIIAAEQTARSCYAMEIDPLYVDVAVKRWQAFTGKSAVREACGRAFDELSDART